jgi:hypothetical protein
MAKADCCSDFLYTDIVGRKAFARENDVMP